LMRKKACARGLGLYTEDMDTTKTTASTASTAPDYLVWSSAAEPDWVLLRRALEGYAAEDADHEDLVYAAIPRLQELRRFGMISDRARGVRRVVRTWERAKWGPRSRCAYERALAEARALAARLRGLPSHREP
jgi:hypothetical protein